MAKISHGGNTWRSEGLVKKYKAQVSFDTPTNKHKSKKDTRKWCRGKIGIQHEIRRYFYRVGWENKRTNWIRSKCINCDKEFRSKNSSIPLIIELDYEDGKSYPIQVKMNGIAIPINYQLFQGGHYCNACQIWEFDY